MNAPFFDRVHKLNVGGVDVALPFKPDVKIGQKECCLYSGRIGSSGRGLYALPVVPACWC